MGDAKVLGGPFEWTRRDAVHGCHLGPLPFDHSSHSGVLMSHGYLVTLTRILVAVVMALVAIVTYAPPSRAVAADRECPDAAVLETDSRRLCINGSSDSRVRGLGTVGQRQACLDQVQRRPGGLVPRFDRHVCGGNFRRIEAEKIAQSRFSQWLNGTQQASHPFPGAAPDGVAAVHPDVQWEISASTAPPKYADVLRYKASWGGQGFSGAAAGPDPSLVPMDLWELKTSVN